MSASSPTTQASTVNVGGHTYRVNSTASADDLAHLAALVDERLLALPVSQRGDPKSLVLIALGFAHDLEQERQLRATERHQTEQRVRDLIARVDQALGHVDINGDPLSAPEAATDSTVVDTSPTLSTGSPEQALIRTALPVQTRPATARSPDTARRRP